MSIRACVLLCVLLVLLVAWQVVLPGGAAAQSGPPPPRTVAVCHAPPGSTIVEPTLPAVPPAGVPPLVGPGTIAVIPPAEDGAVSPITADLGGCRGTLIVPADPTRSLVVRIHGGLPADQVPQPAPPEMANAACRFSVDIFDIGTGQPAAADLPSAFIAALVPGAQPNTMVLVYFDVVNRAWQTRLLSFDTTREAWHVLLASLGSTYSVHAAQIGRMGICVEATTQAAQPKALPATGGAQCGPRWPLAGSVMVGAPAAAAR
jgi:hypothetical protein